MRRSIVRRSCLFLLLSGINLAAGGCGGQGTNANGRPTPTSSPSRSANSSLRYDCTFDPAKGGAEYHVGLGQRYARLADVPFERLGPGDMVRLEYQSTPYYEKVLLSTRGTASSPIVFCGILGPNGERPILDARNATSRLSAPYGAYHPMQEAAVVLAYNTDRWNTPKPGNLVIANFEVRGARDNVAFTDNTGAVSAFGLDSSSVYLFGAENVIIQNTDLHDSGDGLFVNSKDDAGDVSMSRDIVVRGNLIHDNCDARSYLVHNIYTEASGITFELNYLGQCVPGAPGNVLKDRSAGTVIRYNWIESGGHLLDLVDPQESRAIMRNEPDMHETFVYGNVLHDTSPNWSAYLVHYGGDSGGDNATGYVYRQGTLHFFNNTILIQADLNDAWQVALFHLSTNGETANLTNNIFAIYPKTPGDVPGLDLLGTNQGETPNGNLVIGKNWITAGAVASGNGAITGTANLITGTDPGFVNVSGLDLHLASGSPASEAATSQDATVTSRGIGVNFEYVSPVPVPTYAATTVQYQSRADGNHLNLGALH
jgi:hypothetical protein